MKTVFIISPSPKPTGPVKGAYALANALVPLCNVVIVFLRFGPGVEARLDDKVRVFFLEKESKNWIGRLIRYKKLLEESGGRKYVGSISMCLSADFFNLFCSRYAITCSSVRGNLPQNYRLDYGWMGVPLALTHLAALHLFDHVVTMTHSMARQVRRLVMLDSEIIGNFVDEGMLDQYRGECAPSGPFRFVFVGSLSVRKAPELLVSAAEYFRDQDFRIDIIGDGVLRESLEGSVDRKGLRNKIFLHGQLDRPYSIVANADVFVLPSYSEGVSRAALEALYLGIPCVLRDVDGNSDLLSVEGGGVLFDQDGDLPEVMLKAACLSRDRTGRESLLPLAFRQKSAAFEYLRLLELVA